MTLKWCPGCCPTLRDVTEHDEEGFCIRCQSGHASATIKEITMPRDSAQNTEPGFIGETKSASAIRPQHYGGEDNPYEVIKVLKAWLSPEEYRGFLRGNALKYEARYRQKNGVEDLEKARTYQNWLIEFEKEQGR